MAPDGNVVLFLGQGPSEAMEGMYGKDPQAELANLPRIWLEYFWKLGASPPISNNILGILANSDWGSFPYMISIPSEGP